MSTMIATGSVHHLTLTVTDVQRAVEFYTTLLGFQIVMELGPRRLLSNGSVILVLAPPPDPTQALQDDRFSENRVGLNHISLNVARHADLKTAVGLFDAQNVSHRMAKSKLSAPALVCMSLPCATPTTFSLSSPLFSMTETGPPDRLLEALFS